MKKIKNLTFVICLLLCLYGCKPKNISQHSIKFDNYTATIESSQKNILRFDDDVSEFSFKIVCLNAKYRSKYKSRVKPDERLMRYRFSVEPIIDNDDFCVYTFKINTEDGNFYYLVNIIINRDTNTAAFVDDSKKLLSAGKHVKLSNESLKKLETEYQEYIDEFLKKRDERIEQKIPKTSKTE